MHSRLISLQFKELFSGSFCDLLPEEGEQQGRDYSRGVQKTVSALTESTWSGAHDILTLSKFSWNVAEKTCFRFQMRTHLRLTQSMSATARVVTRITIQNWSKHRLSFVLKRGLRKACCCYQQDNQNAEWEEKYRPSLEKALTVFFCKTKYGPSFGQLMSDVVEILCCDGAFIECMRRVVLRCTITSWSVQHSTYRFYCIFHCSDTTKNCRKYLHFRVFKINVLTSFWALEWGHVFKMFWNFTSACITYMQL